MRVPDNLERKLKVRKEAGNYRTLKLRPGLIDFVSNDYLGLGRSKKLHESILKKLKNVTNGSTGSRLLSGNNKHILNTEQFLAKIFRSEKSLLFDSGYMANLAVFSTLPQKGDTILYDELAHACIKDGIRLSLASKFSFKHNDLIYLEKKLKKSKGNIYIAVESIYSMDGDECPLPELIELAGKYSARVIVDEAHSTGIYGEFGSGLCSELGLSDQVFTRIHTFGKAMGVHGAAVVGGIELHSFLINFARPFIYTTAPSPYSVNAVESTFEYLSRNGSLQNQIKNKVSFFKQQYNHACQNSKLTKIDSKHPIQSILIPGNQNAIKASERLQAAGFDVRPILSPTVPTEKERIRICLHTYNTEDEISGLIHSLARL